MNIGDACGLYDRLYYNASVGRPNLEEKEVNREKGEDEATLYVLTMVINIIKQ